MDANGVVRKYGGSITARNLAAQHRANGAVKIADGQLYLNGRERFQRVMHLPENLVVKRLLQSMVLIVDTASHNTGWNRRVVEDRREVESLGFPMILPVRDCRIHFEHVDTADHLVHRTEAHFRHVLANLLGEEEKEIDDMFRLALEFLSKHRILRGDANRASVEMAFPHHDAAHGDQRGRGEAELFGTEQCGDHNVAASLKFAICLNSYAAAQVVQQKNLLRLCQAKLPRNTCMLDGTEAGRSRSPTDSNYENDIGMLLSHRRRN